MKQDFIAKTNPAWLHICVVCTGNICRSPMGEVIIRDALEQAGLANEVRVSSCGIGGWHVGQGADRRAVAELAHAGYDGTQHVAAKLGPEHQDAQLFLAMDAGHVRDLKARGVYPERIRLLRSFDPNSPKGAEVADPYYGDASEFVRTREEIEAATPGVVAWVRDQIATASDR